MDVLVAQWSCSMQLTCVSVSVFPVLICFYMADKVERVKKKQKNKNYNNIGPHLLLQLLHFVTLVAEVLLVVRPDTIPLLFLLPEGKVHDLPSTGPDRKRKLFCLRFANFLSLKQNLPLELLLLRALQLGRTLNLETRTMKTKDDLQSVNWSLCTYPTVVSLFSCGLGRPWINLLLHSDSDTNPSLS